MTDQSVIHNLHIQNLLSFGPDSPQIKLRPLSVLIGPNGSGKSNLIEVIGLLQSTPKDVALPLREGGGIVEWLWKRPRRRQLLAEGLRLPTATIEVSASPPHVAGPIRYRLSFTGVNYQLDIRDECVESEVPSSRRNGVQPFFAYINGRPMLRMDGVQRDLLREQINPQLSILAQRKDPAQYPELTYLGQLFGEIRIYRNWEFGPISDARNLFGPEQSTAFLEEDISNLGLMLNRLNSDPESKAELLKYLKIFYEGAEAIETPIEGALVDVRLIERGGVGISAVRLSDGTLRWLALLTILLHPSPPPLVCIEEPELGLHPDIIPPLAQLLREASERMQLVVTTHSDFLVNELSDVPETVKVCEKEDGSTILRRLEPKKLSAWLKTYSLGHLWRKGEIGGNRW
ncbi:MAG TPA: AAA family ATPase [Terriglobia bacterium]